MLEGVAEEFGSALRARGVVRASEIREPDWKPCPSGDRELDRLLGGGWIRPSTVLVWGRAKSGKSRCVYRWASRLGPALVISLEMPRELTVRTMREAGADLAALHIVETADDWQGAAVDIGARAVVFDSISVADRVPVHLLQHAYGWAQQRRAVVFAIAHVNSRGRPSGPEALQHWPDYPVRVARGKKRGTALVSLPQGSRFCAAGSVTLPIV